MEHSYGNFPINTPKGAQLLHIFPIARDIGVCLRNEANGSEALDIRRYYLDDEQRVWRPTAKGIRIPLQEAYAMINVLARAAYKGMLVP